MPTDRDVISVLAPQSPGRLEVQQCISSVSSRSWYASASSWSRALKALVLVSPRLELSMPRPRSRASRSLSRINVD